MSHISYNIPDDWELRKIKSLGTFKNGFGFPERFQGNTNEKIPFLKVSDINNPFEIYVDSASNYVSSKLASSMNWSLIPFGSIIFPKIGVALLKNHRKINTKEVIIDNNMSAFVKHKHINNKYLYYIFKELDMRNFVNISAVPSINFDLLKNFQIPITLDLNLQKQIANYLDKKTSKIDTTIAKNKELINLLEEKRTALINQVVTKGLNPEVPMKDSGIEWIGEIPKNWDMMKISNIFNNIGSGTTPKSSNDEYYNEGNVNWLITGDLNDNYIYNTSTKITKKALHDTPSLKIYPKDSLVIAMYGATIGKLGILNIETCTNQACCVLSRSNTMNIKYAYYWFLGYRNEIISLSYGGGQPNISQDVIKNIKCIVPPFNEQQQIIDYLDSEITKINEIITKVTENINLLEEYKTSLIHHVVTGKIDVRGEEI